MAQPYGHCENQFGVECSCLYGCVRDTDCASGSICVCADPVGQCERARCTSDASCNGCDCIDSTDDPGCPGKSFACQTPTDQCTSDSDCSSGMMCSSDPSGRHVCAKVSCAIGRPFLVRGEERLAGRAARDDWAARGITPDARDIPAHQRARLAEHWTRIGLMEHASVAAFARFTLHLLALGAPPELVLAAQGATAEETTHARLAFALASAYGGVPVGPDALALDGAMDGFDLESFVATLLHEGCIGETVAAIEAREALDRARDPAVREVLTTIARDEQRHAELAWRTLTWLVGQGRVSRSVVHCTLARALDDIAGALRAHPTDSDLVFHGIVGDAERRELRKSALERVITPCARALLDEAASSCASCS
jgi:hypothetical protein